MRELAHLQRIFDRRARAIQLRRLLATGDRQYLQVQAGGHALVQAQFFFAEVLACRQRGEVEKAEVHRLLDLVGELAGENDPGDVCFDDPQVVDRMRIEGRILQGGDQCLAHGLSLLKLLEAAWRFAEKPVTRSKTPALWRLRPRLQTAERASDRHDKAAYNAPP
ncbi:hypothetical protein D3C77_578430 [compost metagenome]